MPSLRTALVGCGKVGHLHAKALRNVPESTFVAVCGRDLKKTEAFAAAYNVKAYTDVEEMIAREGVQAVTICTPHPLHALHAVKAAKAGVHLLVEKPLASNLRLRCHPDRQGKVASKWGWFHSAGFTLPARGSRRPSRMANWAGRSLAPSPCMAGAMRPITAATPGAVRGRAKAAAYW